MDESVSLSLTCISELLFDIDMDRDGSNVGKIAACCSCSLLLAFVLFWVTKDYGSEMVAIFVELIYIFRRKIVSVSFKSKYFCLSPFSF
jgi:hypothetical protein